MPTTNQSISRVYVINSVRSQVILVTTARSTISNSNWTEWSTKQGVIGRFEITRKGENQQKEPI